MDAETAKRGDVLYKVASDIKQNLQLLKQANIPVLDPSTKLVGKLPKWIIVAIFRIMVSMKLTGSALLGNHALAAKQENLQLDKAFREKTFIKQRC
jgi:2-dehydropantoate 2-reductase